MTSRSIAVLGEALVDEFHDGPVAGGAPFNVARSVAALGAPVQFISRLGADDANGRFVRNSARRYGLGEQGLQRDDIYAWRDNFVEALEAAKREAGPGGGAITLRASA